MPADPSDAPGHAGDQTPALRPEVASILATEHGPPRSGTSDDV